MKAVPAIPPVRPSSGLAGALGILFLTACTHGPPPETAAPPMADSVEVGYGTAARDHLVQSGSTVAADDKGAPRFRSMSEMLSRVPGLMVSEHPGGRLLVQVRGATSFQGGQTPLFILDGIAVGSVDAITGIDPNSIASITVLKDAGETAIYGSRGANGVILIKTKRSP